MAETRITGPDLIGRLLVVEAFAAELVADQLAGQPPDAAAALLGKMTTRAKALVAELGKPSDPVTAKLVGQVSDHVDAYAERFASEALRALQRD
jgi:hypothetical protein